MKFEEVVYDVLTSRMLSSHGSVASLDGFASLDTNAYNLYNMCAYYFGCLNIFAGESGYYEIDSAHVTLELA